MKDLISGLLLLLNPIPYSYCINKVSICHYMAHMTSSDFHLHGSTNKHAENRVYYMQTYTDVVEDTMRPSKKVHQAVAGSQLAPQHFLLLGITKGFYPSNIIDWNDW